MKITRIALATRLMLGAGIVLTVTLLALFSQKENSQFQQEHEKFIASGEGAKHVSVRIEFESEKSIKVRELVTLETQGEYVKHGFLKNLPVESLYTEKQPPVPLYELLRIVQDNHELKGTVESTGSAQTIAVGDKDKVLDPGEHIFALEYRIRDGILIQPTGYTFLWNASGVWPTSVQNFDLELLFPDADVARAAIVNSRIFTMGVEKEYVASQFATPISNLPLTETKESSGTKRFFQNSVVLEPSQWIGLLVLLPTGSF